MEPTRTSRVWLDNALAEHFKRVFDREQNDPMRAEHEAESARRAAEKRAKRDAENFVYFARVGYSRVKIGVSWNPGQRVDTLRCADPNITLLGAVPGSYDLETALHHRLAEHRVRGEWFAWVPDVIDVVQEYLGSEQR